MAKATPGVPYTIVPGDTLSEIAKQAYGNGRRWREIWQANQTVLRSGDPNLIYPGEVITIPKIAELEGQKNIDLPGKAFDNFTIVVDDTELLPESARVVRTMDTAADGWTATIAYNRDNPTLYELLRPYQYNPSRVYVGGRLVVTGELYNVGIDIGADSIRKDLAGFTSTVGIVDSSAPKPPYEFKNVKLDQIAERLAEPFQIPVIFDGDPGGQFKKVVISRTEKVFEFLAKLAKQRSLLVTSTAEGELLFTQANTGAEPVGSLIQGLPPFQTGRVNFDGRRRFRGTKAISKRRGPKTKSAVSKDLVVPLSRFRTFSADDSTSGDVQRAADWDRSKQVGDSLGFKIPVSSWYAPNGELWAENTIVTLRSPEIYCPDGFDFIIRAVEYIFDSSGRTAELSLVPPQVYTGDVVDEPWII